MQTAYIIVSSIMFLFFGVIWKSGDWFNVIIKMILIILTVCGAYLLVNGVH